MQTRYSLIKKSSNKKTGEMCVISSGKDTCPHNCPLRESSCYGYSIPYLHHHWKRWTAEGLTLPELCVEIRQLPKGSKVRYGEVGDLPGDGKYISLPDLLELVEAFESIDAQAFTYTHYLHEEEATEHNLNCINVANVTTDNFTVNISCEDIHHAAKLQKLDLLVTCIIPDDGKTDWKKNKSFQVDGVSAVICPAVWREDTQCISCGGKNGPLCARKNQKNPPIICFPSHGPRRRILNEKLKNEDSNNL